MCVFVCVRARALTCVCACVRVCVFYNPLQVRDRSLCNESIYWVQMLSKEKKSVQLISFLNKCNNSIAKLKFLGSDSNSYIKRLYRNQTIATLPRQISDKHGALQETPYMH